MPASEEEVGAIINKSPNTSCELDPVPIWLLKQCLDELLPLVTNIINSSMETSYAPREVCSYQASPQEARSGSGCTEALQTGV